MEPLFSIGDYVISRTGYPSIYMEVVDVLSDNPNEIQYKCKFGSDIVEIFYEHDLELYDPDKADDDFIADAKKFNGNM